MKRMHRALSFSCLLAVAGCNVPQPDGAPSGSVPDAGQGSTDRRTGNARERIEHLEPLPQNAITGTDADNDHIRDDVQQFIERQAYATREPIRLAARQYARAEQHGLAFARDPDRSQDAGDEITRGIECLYAYLPPDDADAVWKELQAQTIDSDERAMEFFALQDALAGGYFESAPERSQACAFDMTGIAP